MSIIARLAELKLTLPAVAAPVGAYVPVRQAGKLIYTAGQIPIVGGVAIASGLVGHAGSGAPIGDGQTESRVSLMQAQACARQCVLNALAIVAAFLGGPERLDDIEAVVRLGVFVACGPEFTDHPKVANGASELIVEIFGEKGRHARSAVGCSSLPLGVPVEIEFLFEVR